MGIYFPQLEHEQLEPQLPIHRSCQYDFFQVCSVDSAQDLDVESGVMRRGDEGSSAKL